MSWWDTISRPFGDFGRGIGLGSSGAAANPNQQLIDNFNARNDQTGQPLPWNLNDDSRKDLLSQQAALGGKFADQSEKNYATLGQQGYRLLGDLRNQASGQNSVSAEQLRQALQQNQAQQMSMAQGGNPQDATSRARTAAIQSARLGSGLAGQQAVAGLQERNQAVSQAGQLVQGLRGQDLQGSLGGRQAAITGYGGGGPAQPEKSDIERYGPAAIGAIGAAFSDRRLKTDVRDGDAGANKMLNALRSFTYRYKDEDKHGKGERTGTMAQDLERAGIKHAVIDTPDGKAIHGGHLATANTSMLVALRRRVEKIEKGR